MSNYSIIKHKLDNEVKSRLSRLHDVPLTLYVKGRNPNDLLGAPCVAIVGSRKMSAYGRVVTESFASALAQAGVCIVSGLALGVDATAQRTTLKTNTPTIAVLAGGLDSIHPPTHTGLAENILQNGGCLVSEYPEGTPSLPHQFVARNRIIAALADGVLVTEAALKSGSLHTANFALDLGKPVFAIPGPITSRLSEGTNQLIKSGAIPVTTPQDVMEALGFREGRQQQLSFIGKTESESVILRLLLDGVTSGAELLSASGLTTVDFNQSMTMLEINGHVKSLGNDAWSVS